jgi:tRNA pseudouridine55 synthase
MGKSRADEGAAAVDGLLILDKPKGPTSHDLVDRVRRALGTRRVGHTGTLDPFATGLLGVCVGRATRLARFLDGDKEYEAVARFGFATDTDDATGVPLGPPRDVPPGAAALAAALRALTGEILQRPPAFSAKHVEGRRMHELARAGKAPELPPVPVRVERLELLAMDGARARFRVLCSPGTYVRALARDLGAALGCGAHLEELRRTRSGPLDLGRALHADALDPASARAALWPMAAAVGHLPAVVVEEPVLDRVRHGHELPLTAAVGGDWVRVLDPAGALVAVARVRGTCAHPEVVVAA